MLKELLRTVTEGKTPGVTRRTVRSHGDGGPAPEDDRARRAETSLSVEQLVPPDDRVLMLLEDHGGRMWQQDVVDETGYSAGTVSQVLSEMEANGQVTRYWKGGSKVVTLNEPRTDEASR